VNWSEIILVIALAVGISSAVGGFSWMLLSMVWQRWKLDYKGHHIEVQNKGLREQILVDGEVVPDTWFDGNRLTYAVHKVTLPSGDVLTVDVRGDSMGIPGCQIIADGALVFDSNPGRAALLHTTMQVGRQVAAEPAVPVEVPPRLAAARVLLTEVAGSGDERVKTAARDLVVALEKSFEGLTAAENAAEAHATLGGDPAEVAALIAAREASVAELLSATRALHLAATRHTPDEPRALQQVQDVLQQVEAEQEVDVLARARRAAAARRERQ